MCMLVCYLDCQEAGLGCYLVIYVYRKPIRYIAVVLLPFANYLLIPPRINGISLLKYKGCDNLIPGMVL
jgi:hypothetical protein